MSRRGEVPFVATRVGRSNDPREVLGLARDLRVPRSQALGMVTLWEELILEVGDAKTGRLRGYAADHIAAKLDWPSNPRKLLDAFERAGLMKRQRGVFFHPYWGESITGQYARDRAELRERWRETKRRQRGAEDVHEESSGHGVDVHPMSNGKTHIDRSIHGENGAAPPPPPAPRGANKGYARWEWVRQNHNRPTNPQACIGYLDAMPDDEWPLFQWVCTPSEAGGPRSSSRKKRVLELDSRRILLDRAYLQFLPEWRQKLEREKRGANGAPPANGAQKALAAPPRDDSAERLAGAVKFVLAALADADLSADEKEGIKAKWRKAHPTITPPWEAHQGPAQA